MSCRSASSLTRSSTLNLVRFWARYWHWLSMIGWISLMWLTAIRILNVLSFKNSSSSILFLRRISSWCSGWRTPTYCLKSKSIRSQKGRIPVPPETKIILPALTSESSSPLPFEQLSDRFFASLSNNLFVNLPSLYFLMMSGTMASLCKNSPCKSSSDPSWSKARAFGLMWGSTLRTKLMFWGKIKLTVLYNLVF